MKACAVVLWLVCLLGCGRAGVESLRNGAVGATDGQTGSTPDTGVGLDVPNLIPEVGSFECNTAADCPPVPADYCPAGQMDRWRCENRQCRWTCIPSDPPTQSCNNDCDCPPGLSCGGTECVVADRQNFCCNYEPCPPGRECVQPDGRWRTCPGPGPIQDGGPPPKPDAAEPPGDPDSGRPNAFCNNDCDCDFSTACIAGACLPAGRINQCCNNPQCPPGDRCVNPDGSMDDCATGVPVGDACSQSTQCTALGICLESRFGFPNGYCSQDCGRQGLTCPGDSVCREVGGDQLCLDGCLGNFDCRTDYVCTRFGLGTDKVCWPRGPSSMNPQGEPVGGTCQNDNDCSRGLTCIQQQSGSWSDGYCTVPYCDSTGNVCPSNSTCYAFPQWFPVCLASCINAGSQSNCRNGYYCLGPAGQAGVCMTQ